MTLSASWDACQSHQEVAWSGVSRAVCSPWRSDACSRAGSWPLLPEPGCPAGFRCSWPGAFLPCSRLLGVGGLQQLHQLQFQPEPWWRGWETGGLGVGGSHDCQGSGNGTSCGADVGTGVWEGHTFVWGRSLDVCPCTLVCLTCWVWSHIFLINITQFGRLPMFPALFQQTTYLCFIIPLWWENHSDGNSLALGSAWPEQHWVHS
jgi:hypothetical protein